MLWYVTKSNKRKTFSNPVVDDKDSNIQPTQFLQHDFYRKWRANAASLQQTCLLLWYKYSTSPQLGLARFLTKQPSIRPYRSDLNPRLSSITQHVLGIPTHFVRVIKAFKAGKFYWPLFLFFILCYRCLLTQFVILKNFGHCPFAPSKMDELRGNKSRVWKDAPLEGAPSTIPSFRGKTHYQKAKEERHKQHFCGHYRTREFEVCRNPSK